MLHKIVNKLPGAHEETLGCYQKWKKCFREERWNSLEGQHQSLRRRQINPGFEYRSKEVSKQLCKTLMRSLLKYCVWVLVTFPKDDALVIEYAGTEDKDHVRQMSTLSWHHCLAQTL